MLPRKIMAAFFSCVIIMHHPHPLPQHSPHRWALHHRSTPSPPPKLPSRIEHIQPSLPSPFLSVHFCPHDGLLPGPPLRPRPMRSPVYHNLMPPEMASMISSSALSPAELTRRFTHSRTSSRLTG